jgi:1,4-alpha-glucan branching enzyme
MIIAAASPTFRVGRMEYRGRVVVRSRTGYRGGFMISISERLNTERRPDDPGQGTTTVAFRTKQPGVTGRRISLVGDFNDWDPRLTPMEESDEGTWAAVLELPPGRRYRFRYLSEDGQWFNDEAAHSYEENEHGGHNSVLDLTASAAVPSGQLSVSAPIAGATPE